VNLDPANENMQYKASVDIMNLITVEEVMDKFNLGPNGALMYCMEFLEKNFEWLLQQVSALEINYFIFDCPGQVELYTHHNSISNIFSKFETHRFQLCAVNLIDSHYCSEPNKFIAALLLSLNTMLQIGLPHVNVFSKADLFKKYESKLLFSLDYYTEVLDLKYLVEALNQSPSMAKYAKLNSAIVSMVEDYSLVTFQPLDVNKMESLVRLKSAIDKANGYIYGASEEQSINSLLACAVGAETQTDKLAKDIDPYMS
jgi:GPN-loop GTPase